MPAGQKQERRTSAARPRSHHISSIAHLFLAGEEISPALQPLSQCVSFCVAGSQRSAVTALTSSRLASLAGGCGQTKGCAGRVLLWEDERTPRSFQGYFTGFRVEKLAKDQDRFPLPIWPVSHWPFRTHVVELLSGDAGVHSSFRTNDSVAIVQHLGHVDESTVRNLQSCVASQTGKSHALNNGPGEQSLIWCLVGDEALSLVSCSRLGRLVDFLGVQQLFLLVFPDCWQSLGMPGVRVAKTAVGQTGSLDPDRAHKLGQRVAPGRRVAVLPIEARPGAGHTDGLDEALLSILDQKFSHSRSPSS